MKIRKELKVVGEYATLQKLLNDIIRWLPSNWKLEGAKELTLPVKNYSFIRAASQTEPESNVHILRRTFFGLELNVSNILLGKVSLGTPYLSIEQYNAIVSDFSNNVLGPHAKLAGLPIEETDENVDITHWITHEAERLLRLFSCQANKGTGSDHPYDFKRWAEFISQVHRDSSSLGSELLRRWLIEEEGWPEQLADGLASEYSFALDLLKRYDKYVYINGDVANCLPSSTTSTSPAGRGTHTDTNGSPLHP